MRPGLLRDVKPGVEITVTFYKRSLLAGGPRRRDAIADDELEGRDDGPVSAPRVAA